MVLEHPEITRARAEGYPPEPEGACAICREPLVDGEAYQYNGETICEGCLIDAVRDYIDSLSADELAKVIGAKAL